jgi:hypothetical protein
LIEGTCAIPLTDVNTAIDKSLNDTWWTLKEFEGDSNPLESYLSMWHTWHDGQNSRGRRQRQHKTEASYERCDDGSEAADEAGKIC